MNKIKWAIPTISGISIGIFLWDFLPEKSPASLALLIVMFGILFNVIWMLYSNFILKKSQKSMGDDALTFIPFIALLLFPIKSLVSFDTQYSKFGNIPSAILLIFALSGFIFLKVLFYEKEIKDLKKDKLVYMAMISYMAIFSIVVVFKHMSFFSTVYDLAIYDQGIWGLKNFMLTDSIMGFPIIGGHFQPILFILAIFYVVYSSPITILVLQTIMLAIGAIPLYLLAKKVLKNRLISFSISLAYLLNLSIQYANLFDFHPLVLAVPFILFAFYFLEKRSYKAFFISMIIAGLCKEYIPLMFVPFGIYLFFAHKKKMLGITMAIIGAGWFALNISVIIPYFLGNYYLMFQQNSYFGTSLSEFITTLITRPIYSAQYFLVFNKLALLILLLIPIAFGIFALLAPEIILLGITELVIMMLRTPDSLSEIVYHHQASFIPFIFVASIYGIKRFNRFIHLHKIIPAKNILPAISLLLLSTAIFSNIAYGPFTVLYDIKEFNPYTDYAKTGRKFVSMIPEDASVASPDWVLPHLSNREKAYTLPHFLKTDLLLFESGELEMPEYILMDLSAALLDIKRSALKLKTPDLDNLFNNKNYGIIDSKGTWVLLKYNSSYEEGICSIKPFLNKNSYPHLNITIKEKGLIEKC